MSDRERERPTHATGEEYHEALSGLIEQDKARGIDTRSGGSDDAPGKAHERPGEEKKSHPGVVALLLLVLVGLVAWNVYYLSQPIEPAPPQNQRRVASVKLYHAAQAIERHRAQQGQLPAELAGLNVPRGDFEYIRADTGYTLTLRTPDTMNRYRSGDDLRDLIRRAGILGGDSGEEQSADDSDEGSEG